MKKIVGSLGAILMAGLVLILFTAFPAAAQNAQNVPVAHNPTIIYEDHHDVSPPLREMIKNMPPESVSLARHAMQEHTTGRARITSDVPDPVGQTEVLPPVSATIGLNFAGVGQGDYGFSDSVSPPDTNAGVGATQVLDWVNLSFAIFDKSTGALIAGPTAGNAFWSGFGGSCQSYNSGDIEARYDQLASRWVVSQLMVATTPYEYCVAVSTTSDATGTYNRYAFSTGNNFDDYPKLGVWPDAYYWMYDDFVNGESYEGPIACALNRTAMLAGETASMQCFGPYGSESPFLPSDLDGQSLFTSGEPAFYVSLYNSTTLHFYQFHVDFANPSQSTFTGPLPVTVASYSDNCPYPDSCVPEPGGSTLEGMSDRPLFRLAYRNFGTYESLTFNHSVKPSTGSQVLAMRWTKSAVRAPPRLSTRKELHRAPCIQSGWGARHSISMVTWPWERATQTAARPTPRLALAAAFSPIRWGNWNLRRPSRRAAARKSSSAGVITAAWSWIPRTTARSGTPPNTTRQQEVSTGARKSRTSGSRAAHRQNKGTAAFAACSLGEGLPAKFGRPFFFRLSRSYSAKRAPRRVTHRRRAIIIGNNVGCGNVKLGWISEQRPTGAPRAGQPGIPKKLNGERVRWRFTLLPVPTLSVELSMPDGSKRRNGTTG